jgi:hypothetical protein
LKKIRSKTFLRKIEITMHDSATFLMTDFGPQKRSDVRIEPASHHHVIAVIIVFWDASSMMATPLANVGTSTKWTPQCAEGEAEKARVFAASIARFTSLYCCCSWDMPSLIYQDQLFKSRSQASLKGLCEWCGTRIHSFVSCQPSLLLAIGFTTCHSLWQWPEQNLSHDFSSNLPRKNPQV